MERLSPTIRKSSFGNSRIPMFVMDSKLHLPLSNNRVVSGYCRMFVEVDLFFGKSFNWWG